MNCYHISLTPIKNETKIFKFCSKICKKKLFRKIIIIGLYKKNLKIKENVNNEFELIRFKLLLNNKNFFFLKNIFCFTEFSIRVLRYIVFTGNKGDIIHLHHVSLLILVPILKYFSRKVIYDAHELETEVCGLRGIKKLIYKFLEKRFIHKVNFSLFVSKSIENWYIENYKINNTYTIYNCPSFKDYSFSQDKIKKEFKKINNIDENNKILIYQGALIRGRGIERLLDYFLRKNILNYALLILGYGELEQLVKDYSNKCKNIIYKEAVSPNMINNITSNCDAGIVLFDESFLSYKYALPNKLFEYILSGIPVIGGGSIEMERIINEYQLGIYLTNYSDSALKESIKAIDSININENIINRLKEKYDWDNQFERMYYRYKYINELQ